MPYADKSDMLPAVKGHLRVQTTGQPQRTTLPQPVICIDANVTLEPEDPGREVEIRKVQVWQVQLRQALFDTGSVIHARNHPDFVTSLRQPDRHLPSDLRL
ncbi:MAG TPA: hypothetical protein PLC86_13370 [Candidatus Accumulibacter phosphatis]|nr:hypothetical protein [Candidatus Accumulibacter phosphatis]